MKVRALKLQDVEYGTRWQDEIEDHWEFDDFRADPAWREGWVSMDTVFYSGDDDRLYLGITSFAADIFRAYDRQTGQFADLGYGRIADPFDAKFHRSLVKWDRDGCLYGAIALLHDVDRYWEAPVQSGHWGDRQDRHPPGPPLHPVDLPGPGPRGAVRLHLHAGAHVPL